MRIALTVGLNIAALVFAGCSTDSTGSANHVVGDASATSGGTVGASGAGGASTGGTGRAGGTSNAGGTTNGGAGTTGAGGDLKTCPPLPRGTPPAGTCTSPDDTDRDGVPDCKDPCPFDKNKLDPGICGCGTPDIDTDGDGLADCVDRCPLDPHNTDRGQCGCVGEIALKAAGTPCTDSVCGETGTTCDGAGVCGHPSDCSPCPGGHFIAASPIGVAYYWFCGALPRVIGPACVQEDGGGGPAVTRAEAKAACAAKGFALLQVNSMSENRFLTPLLTARTWIGANDLGTPEQWYWPSATSDSDALFWTGGVDGSVMNSHYTNWANGTPGGASCASMDPKTGLWSDTDCGEKLAYICERLFF